MFKYGATKGRSNERPDRKVMNLSLSEYEQAHSQQSLLGDMEDDIVFVAPLVRMEQCAPAFRQPIVEEPVYEYRREKLETNDDKARTCCDFLRSPEGEATVRKLGWFFPPPFNSAMRDEQIKSKVESQKTVDEDVQDE